MVETPFAFRTNPLLLFGAGRFQELPQLIADQAHRVLLLTGRASLRKSEQFARFQAQCRTLQLELLLETIAEEPSPALVNNIVAQYRERHPDLVLAVGGGSVLDGGKAVAAMLTASEPVERYLEGIGNLKPDGNSLPFWAVPTTAGTGSEATKNAVLRRVGPQGYKKSLRHDNYVPRLAVLDPELSLSCPQTVTAACAMDALSQLLEAWLSTKASPLTDALALSGLQAAATALPALALDQGQDLHLRSCMAYAAYLSGVCLANAGLGTVHGLAGPLGGLVPAAHGALCGILLAPVMEETVRHLEAGRGDPRALEKAARAGAVLARDPDATAEQGRHLLLDILQRWSQQLALPSLGQLGVDEAHVETVLQQAGNKNNPVALEKDEMQRILRSRF